MSIDPKLTILANVNNRSAIGAEHQRITVDTEAELLITNNHVASMLLVQIIYYSTYALQ